MHARADDVIAECPPFSPAASVMSLAETLVGAVRGNQLRTAQAVLERLRIREVPADALRLALLRADTGLRLPDCCVLQAAESFRAERVLTFDERLASQARKLGFSP
ncbi:MAG: PIN domain-containing protein [Solirubrobacteraceae bacterium]